MPVEGAAARNIGLVDGGAGKQAGLVAQRGNRVGKHASRSQARYEPPFPLARPLPAIPPKWDMAAGIADGMKGVLCTDAP